MEPAAYDHYRPTDADHPDGIYRVVGTGDQVALLRVGDADGRRVHTGDLLTVDDLAEFEPAANPDGSRSPVALVSGFVESTYWSLRTFVRTLAAHPLPTAVALALLLAGNVADTVFGLGGTVGGILIIVGGLALGYVGSGRL